MKKLLISTALFTLITMTAQAIDEYQFHKGTAVLKGRILNKPAKEWTTLSITTYNHFSDKDRVVSIAVNDDGSYTTIEGNTGDNPNGEVVIKRRYPELISAACRPAYGFTTPAD